MKKIFIYFVLVSTFLTFQNLQASTIENAVINDESNPPLKAIPVGTSLIKFF